MYNKLEQKKTNMMMIGLVGKARCGKSSVAKVLVRDYGYLQYAMAGPIRKAILAGLPFLDSRFLHEDKEEIVPELGVTGRHLLQSLGHEWGRKSSEDIWIKSLEAEFELMKIDHRKVVVDDVRYENEVDWIKSKGGTILGIDRPFLKDDSSAWRSHPSENGIDPSKIDRWIANISPLTIDLEYAVMATMSSLLDPEYEAVQ
jgi:hypothetical protein